MHSQIKLMVIFTICNLLIWTFYLRGSTKNKYSASSCSSDSLVVKLTEFLKENGKSSLAKILPSKCMGPQPSTKTETNLKYTLRYLLEDCRHKDIIEKTKQSVEYPLLTLFTTWVPSTEKYFVHENTMKNWKSFFQKIKFVIFTNSSEMTAVAEKAGWDVLQITKHAADGIPILKAMFQSAIATYNSTYYAYCNSDILFEDGLISTLIKVAQTFNTSEPLLIVGQRTNALYITNQEASSHKRIEKTAINRGMLFVTYAQDYFIASKSFPWAGVPNLVVGRVAYDNWLTAHALCLNITLIDSTESILALHQTTSSGNKEGSGHPNGDYNVKLLRSLESDNILRLGHTDCSPWQTYRTHCGYTEVIRRKNVHENCKCLPKEL